MMRSGIRTASLLVLCAAVSTSAGCGDSSPGLTRSRDTAAASSGTAAAAPSGTPAPAPAAVKTASSPTDACGWIPVADVEQMVGMLEGPPRAEGDECIYPLAQKSPAFAQMRRGLGADDPQNFQDTVRLAVDLSANSIRDLAAGAVAKMFAREFGEGPSQPAKNAVPPPGWDAVTGLPYTFIGRVGHIQITVFSPPELKTETQMALAAKVRDAIPDLPFPADSSYQLMPLGVDRNPCELLTRAEAEAVLGPLTVAPYRAVENGARVFERGNACAYYSAGHRAFVVIPEWTDGAMTFKLSKGVGGFIGAVVPLDKTAIEGPWDEGRVDGTTGMLMFLKGDRNLRVDYLTSSTDRAGALKLAATAMQRLGS